MPHLAPTYAAVCSLCILGRYWEGAYDIINRYVLQASITNQLDYQNSNKRRRFK